LRWVRSRGERRVCFCFARRADCAPTHLLSRGPARLQPRGAAWIAEAVGCEVPALVSHSSGHLVLSMCVCEMRVCCFRVQSAKMREIWSWWRLRLCGRGCWRRGSIAEEVPARSLVGSCLFLSRDQMIAPIWRDLLSTKQSAQSPFSHEHDPSDRFFSVRLDYGGALSLRVDPLTRPAQAPSPPALLINKYLQ